MVFIRKNSRGKLNFFLEDKTMDNQYREIPLAYVKDYQTVFAMTVHKSQGSEFEHVVVMMPSNEESRLLTKELLYTAVTRASKQVLLIGKENIIIKASNKKVDRASGLEERVKNISTK